MPVVKLTDLNVPYSERVRTDRHVEGDSRKRPVPRAITLTNLSLMMIDLADGAGLTEKYPISLDRFGIQVLERTIVQGVSELLALEMFSFHSKKDFYVSYNEDGPLPETIEPVGGMVAVEMPPIQVLIDIPVSRSPEP
jgi:hypothetical protein